MRAVVLLVLLGMTLSVSAAPAPLPRRTPPPPPLRVPNWSQEFISRVGTEIVRAARESPKTVEMERFKFAAVKGNKARTDLEITMTWQGRLTKKKFTSTIVVKLANTGGRWIVVDLDYQDDNRVSVGKLRAAWVLEWMETFNR
jgi:hypothetical protein